MAKPIIATNIIDINETTINLTGNASKLVKYSSTAQATMSATSPDGAAINEDMYIIRNGNKTGFGKTCTFDKIESNVFDFSAEDEYGNIGTATVTPTMVEYIKPTCNINKVTIDGNGTATLECSGLFFNSSFGAVTNTINIYYRCAEIGHNWGEWVELPTPTKYGNNYYITSNIPGLDYKKGYTFQCKVEDKLNTVESYGYSTYSKPLYHWNKEGFTFNIPVQFAGGVSNSDIIVEQGEELGWTYRKWQSGFTECWKTFQKTIDPSEWYSWGSMWLAPVVDSDRLPFTFESHKRELATVHGSASGMLIGGAWMLSSTTTGEYFICSANKYSSSYSFLVDIYVSGFTESWYVE